MTFFYQSTERLQLFFDSPNHCATFLAILLTISVGILVRLRANVRGGVVRVAEVVFVAAISLLMLGLVATYSRGGWLAFASVMLLLVILLKSYRVVGLLSLMLFLIMILFAPSGDDRIASYFNSEDKSIANRFVVWKGALAMAHDNWLFGVGRDKFGDVFHAWYQPLDMKTRYLAAINNYFTIGAEQGLFALLLYLLIVVGPALIGGWAAWKRHNLIMISLASGILVFAVSSLFTFNLSDSGVTRVFVCLTLICCGYIAFLIFSSQTFRRELPPLVGKILCACVVITFLGYITGKVVSEAGKRVDSSVQLSKSDKVAKITVVSPRYGPSRGLIVFFSERGQSAAHISRGHIRPLVERGYTVVSTGYLGGGLSALDAATSILEYSFLVSKQRSLPMYAAGLGDGGRIALIANAASGHKYQIEAVAAMSADTTWPISALSPVDLVETINSPVLLMYTKSDSVARDAQHFIALASRSFSESKMLVVDDPGIAGSQFSAVLDEFFASLHSARRF